MDTEIILPYVQQPATYLYPEPDSSTPRPRSYFLNIHFNTIFPSTPRYSK